MHPTADIVTYSSRNTSAGFVVQGVRNPGTKSRNIRYRLAASSGRPCSFTNIFDKTVVDRTRMRAVLNDAGALVGIADGR
jgi:hypothetical protein